MTEAEWPTCDDPQAMLDTLHGVASERKLRLFACACCRSVWDRPGDERSRRAVGLAERSAEGRATLEEMEVAGDDALDAPWAAIDAGDLDAEAFAHAAIRATAKEAETAAHVAARFARVSVRDRADSRGSPCTCKGGGPEVASRASGVGNSCRCSPD